MQDNPFSTFWIVMRENAEEWDDAHPVWLTGTVVTVEPLVILCGGQELSGADLLVNIQLLRHERDITQIELRGGLDASTDCTIGNTSDISVEGGIMQSRAINDHLLQWGDRVLLLPSYDGQQFVVACKLRQM